MENIKTMESMPDKAEVKKPLRRLNQAELTEILKQHEAWWRSYSTEKDGVQADLSYVDLSGIDLSGKNISGVIFKGANLRNVDFRNSHCREANFEDADLAGAMLEHVNIAIANFTNANLKGANLKNTCCLYTNFTGANLERANFHDAEIDETTNFLGAIIDETTKSLNTECPKEGSFIGYKKACKKAYSKQPADWTVWSTPYIVELEIPADAKRNSAATKKCRCSKAKVLSITNLGGTSANILEVQSWRDLNFVYRVGEIVEVPDFNEDWRAECAPGIHFFMNREDAVKY